MGVGDQCRMGGLGFGGLECHFAEAMLATDCLCSRLGAEGIDIHRYGGICIEMLP